MGPLDLAGRELNKIVFITSMLTLVSGNLICQNPTRLVLNHVEFTFKGRQEILYNFKLHKIAQVYETQSFEYIGIKYEIRCCNASKNFMS